MRTDRLVCLGSIRGCRDNRMKLVGEASNIGFITLLKIALGKAFLCSREAFPVVVGKYSSFTTTSL